MRNLLALTILITASAAVAREGVAVREEGGALGWARAMDHAAQEQRDLALQTIQAAPMVASIDPHGVAYAGWALAFAFFLLLVASRLSGRGGSRQLTLHGDVPELFFIPKGLLGRRPRR